MSDNETLIRVDNLSVVVNDAPLVEHLSFNIEKGTITVIIGPNGAGKTTLFRAMLGLVPFDGVIEKSKSSRCAYVPQNFTIPPDMPLTVKEFFELKTKDTDVICAALQAVGMHKDEHHLHHHVLSKRVGVLSGGERQKVSIAWALCDNPDILFFDEPTAGIDVGGEETIYGLLKHIRDERGITIIMISHELNVVYQYADSVICLNRKMICQGPPQAVLNPQILKELYGDGFGVYKHQERENHNHGHA